MILADAALSEIVRCRDIPREKQEAALRDIKRVLAQPDQDIMFGAWSPEVQFALIAAKAYAAGLRAGRS